MPSSSRPTLGDVALAGGVGRMAVSRVLSQPDLVSEATRREVLAAIKRLDYVPNNVARELVLGRSERVCIIVNSVAKVRPQFFSYFRLAVLHAIGVVHERIRGLLASGAP